MTAGRAVARNNLLKCAIGGEDPNWGRVLSAVGTTDAVFLQPDRLNVAINGIWVCRHGAAGDERSKVDLKPKDVTITVDLSAGPHSAIDLDHRPDRRVCAREQCLLNLTLAYSDL